MSIYANGLNININEVAVLTFLENVNGKTEPVCQVAVTYEVLKQLHVGLSSVIEQHDARLGSVVSDMGRAN
jgi:hypothetical protein